MHDTDQAFASVETVARELGLAVPAEPCAGDPRAELSLEWIKPGQIVVARQYQRRISGNGARRIRASIGDFEWRKFAAVVVAEIGPHEYAVIDGQHRAVIGWAIGAEVIPAIVLRADTPDQARAFVGINAHRTTVASIDKFRARVASGDPAAVTVHEILSELEISSDVAAGTSLAPRQTRAVAKLEKLVKAIGRGLTFTTLEMLIDAQPDQRNLLTRFAIEATAKAKARIVEAGGDLDRLALILEETDFESIRDSAAQLTKLQGGPHAKHGTELLLRAFNKGQQRKVA